MLQKKKKKAICQYSTGQQVRWQQTVLTLSHWTLAPRAWQQKYARAPGRDGWGRVADPRGTVRCSRAKWRKRAASAPTAAWNSGCLFVNSRNTHWVSTMCEADGLFSSFVSLSLKVKYKKFQSIDFTDWLMVSCKNGGSILFIDSNLNASITLFSSNAQGPIDLRADSIQRAEEKH